MSRQTKTVNEWDLDSFNYGYDGGAPTMQATNGAGASIVICLSEGDSAVTLEIVIPVVDGNGERSYEDVEPFYAHQPVGNWRGKEIRGATALLLATHTDLDISLALEALDALWAMVNPQ